MSNRYLDIIRKLETCDKSDKSDRSPLLSIDSNARRCPVGPPEPDFGRFGRTLSEFERRCPDRVDLGDWHLAVEDGRQFLAKWGTQAEALGWSADDLFGLAPVPDKPHSTYRRLSRYDLTGLLWLLRGRPVVALTAATAAVQAPGGVITYRRQPPQ